LNYKKGLTDQDIDTIAEFLGLTDKD